MTDPVAAPPTCYRHPDRETYISCTRCGRPICPDCMVDASVGFQCPECVRTAQPRPARTVFGGGVSAAPGLVTRLLVGVCVVVFLLQQLPGARLEARFGMFPPAVADGEYYRLITAAFLHFGLLHILFNMYALWIFGPGLEQLFGRARFLALYLLSAVGGTAASYAFSGVGVLSAGASGAIFGILGAYLVVNRRLSRDSSGLLVLLALNFGLAFVYRGIDWHAHVGGLVTGIAAAAVLVYAPRANRTAAQAVGLAVVLAVIVAIDAWRTTELRTALGIVTG